MKHSFLDSDVFRSLCVVQVTVSMSLEMLPNQFRQVHLLHVTSFFLELQVNILLNLRFSDDEVKTLLVRR